MFYKHLLFRFVLGSEQTPANYLQFVVYLVIVTHSIFLVTVSDDQ